MSEFFKASELPTLLLELTLVLGQRMFEERARLAELRRELYGPDDERGRRLTHVAEVCRQAAASLEVAISDLHSAEYAEHGAQLEEMRHPGSCAGSK